MSASLQPLRFLGTRLFRINNLQRTYATSITSVTAHESVAKILNQSIAAGKHTVTAIQCTVLPLQSSIISSGPGEEDMRLGQRSFTTEVPEKMIKIQALVELVVKASDFVKVQDVGVLGN